MDRDLLLKIGGQTPNYTIFHSLIDQEHFKEEIDQMSQQLLDSLNNCSAKEHPDAHAYLKEMEWPIGVPYLTYLSNSVTATED